MLVDRRHGLRSSLHVWIVYLRLVYKDTHTHRDTHKRTQYLLWPFSTLPWRWISPTATAPTADLCSDLCRTIWRSIEGRDRSTQRPNGAVMSMERRAKCQRVGNPPLLLLPYSKHIYNKKKRQRHEETSGRKEEKELTKAVESRLSRRVYCARLALMRGRRSPAPMAEKATPSYFFLPLSSLHSFSSS